MRGQQCPTADRSGKMRTDGSLLAWYLDVVTSDLIKSTFKERLRAGA